MTSFRILIATLGCILSLGIPTVWASPQTYLWRAAELADHAAIVRALQAGAKVNATDKDGWSALLFAATSGNLAVVSSLLAEHANPNLSVSLSYSSSLQPGWTATVRELPQEN